MTQSDGDPAFPSGKIDVSGHGPTETPYYQGMSLRVYAAIKLRVPDSGLEWLDDMILKAKRNDIAGQALVGLLVDRPTAKTAVEYAREAHLLADAMLAASKGDNNAQ